MKNLTFTFAITIITTLTACGSKTDANEKNFSMAMDQYFEAKGNLCLNTRGWPLDLDELGMSIEGKSKIGQVARMEALQKVGLVKREDLELDRNGILGKVGTVKIRRYTLTDAAKAFSFNREVLAFEATGRTMKQVPDLCWGRKGLDKIVKWEGPIKFGDYQEASVVYTYKVNNIATWANNAEIQEAYPQIKRILNGASKDQDRHGVKLTSQGWEAIRIDLSGM